MSSTDEHFTAREEEKAAIVDAMTSVMDGTSHESRRVLLLHGVPGLGKSLLATQALRSAQQDARAQAAGPASWMKISWRWVATWAAPLALYPLLQSKLSWTT
jgi:hypothetical protein